MKPYTLVLPYSPTPFFEKTLLSLIGSDWMERVLITAQGPASLHVPNATVLIGEPLSSGLVLNRMLLDVKTPYLLLMPEFKPVSMESENFEKWLKAAESTNAGLVYSDFYDQDESGKTLHPLNDYQLGSVRDDFEFGPLFLLANDAIHHALNKYGPIPEVKYAGLYDLRLKISVDRFICHLPDPLYTVLRKVEEIQELPQWERIFAYVDSKNRIAQKEMEAVFTEHLKRIGAYLPPDFKEVRQTDESFPVEASVIIPVRNRRDTIGEAIQSALSQKTDFPFNILVVDNHSTDGTTGLLSALTKRYSQIKHILPERIDLEIGGCWNEALRQPACGRYAVQLDSDDLYSSPHTLQKMVDRFRQGQVAMVIGSYTLANLNLEVIPPGLIDHREWTDENGHNNALRVNGLGAPRAFDTSLMRRIRFLNVSYGEDYAAGLRICREFRIGRIYESLYLCRRWSGNTDAKLSIEEINRNNAFKDTIRTEEILARQKMVRGTSM